MASLPDPIDPAASRALPAVRLTSFHLPDAQATAAAGARLAPALQGGVVVALIGELGTGKTTLVRGALRALGWAGSVKSPTYTLVEHYLVSSLYFYHFDFYRIVDPDEWVTSGFSEYFRADAACLVEWPERMTPYLPPTDLEIRLAYPGEIDGAGRNVTLIARTEAGTRCMSAMTPPPV